MEKAGNISKSAKKGAETARRRVRKMSLQEKIDSLCLMDDLFFRKCMEKAHECIEYIVRQLMDDDSLVVKEFSTQRAITNLQGRSVTLDVYAVDGNGREINIEIQNCLRDADVRRARLYSAILDANNLAAGEDPRKLRDTYVFFLVRGCVFDTDKEYIEFIRMDPESGLPMNDGTHIAYLNVLIKSETKRGRLSYDLTCTNPDEFHSEILAKQVKRFKTSEEGRKTMSSIFELERLEGRAEGERLGEKRGEKRGERRGEKRGLAKGLAQGLAKLRESAKRMLALGKLTIAEVAECTGLALKEVQALAAANGGRKVAAL